MVDNRKTDQAIQTRSQDSRPTIGLLMGSLSDPVSGQVWAGVHDVARERGVNLICFAGGVLRSTQGLAVPGNVLYELVSAETLDCLVVWGGGLGALVSPLEVQRFCEQYRPLPIVNAALLLEGIPSVLVDNYQGLRDLMIHLVEVHGARRIAFIRGPQGHPEAEERYRAYADVLAEYDIPLDPDLVAPGAFNKASGVEAISLLLDQRQAKFEAVVAADDVTAIGAMEALQARSLRVPRDVAVVGFDNAEEGGYITPSLTTVPSLAYEQARQAAEMALVLLRGEPVPERVCLPTRVVVRQSCGCLDSTVARATAVALPGAGEPFETALAAQRADLLSEMAQATGAPTSASLRAEPQAEASVEPSGVLSNRVEQILDAFVVELKGRAPGAFLSTLDAILRQELTRAGNVSAWHGALSVLRRRVLPGLVGESRSLAENLWQQARVLIGEMAQRKQASQRFQVEQQTQTLNAITQELITTFDVSGLVDVMACQLPNLGIQRFYLCLYDAERPARPTEWSRLILARDERGRIDVERRREAEAQRFPSHRLAPEGVLSRLARYSLIAEPLYFQEEQLGFALFEADPQKARIYPVLGGQISGALKGALLVQERERLLTNLQRRALQLQTASEVSRATSSILDPAELIQQTVNLVRERFDLYYVGLFLLDDDNRYAVLRAGSGEPGRQMLAAAHRLEIGDSSMIGWCIAHQQARIALDVDQETVRFKNPLLPDTRSELALPLTSGRRAVGAMTIQSTRPAAFTPEDIAVFQAMADQLANAAENAQLFQERQWQITELSILNEISQTFSSVLEFDELLQVIYQQVSRIFDTTNFYIALYDEKANEWASVFDVERGQRNPPMRGKAETGLTGHIVFSGRPLLLRDSQEYMAFHQGHGIEFVGERAKSFLGVPLVAADKTVGVMAIFSYERENLYNGRDQALLTTIGAHAIVVIQNARLFEETSRRAERMTILNRIGLAVASGLGMDHVLTTLYEQCKQVASVDSFYVALYDEASRLIHFPLFCDGEERRPVAPRDIHSQPSLTGHVILSGQTFYSPDTFDPNANLPYPVVRTGGNATRSFLSVPLTLRDKVIGALSMQSLQPNAYSPDDIRMLETMASQAAIALENARLFEETRARAKEMEVLNELGRALTTRLSVEGVLDEAYRGASRLVNTENLYIALYDADKDEVTFALNAAGGEVRKFTTTRRAGQGMTEYIIRQRAPLLIEENVGERLADLGIELIGQTAQSWLGVPLLSGDRVLGVIAVQSYTTPRAYGQRDQDILTAIASQIAIALQNAYLFEQTRAALAEVRRLAAIVENHPDFIGIGTLAGQALYINPAGLSMLGLPSGYDVTTLNARDLYQAEDAQRLIHDGIPTALEKGFWSAEASLRKVGDPRQGADGAIIPVEQTVGINYDVNGKPYSFSITMRDVSERRTAEAALRVSEERLAMALQGSKEGVWDWDIQNNSLYWSPILKEWLGYADDELEISLGAFATLLHPDDRARVDAALEAHLKDGAPYDVELRQRTKSGEYRWFRDRGTATRDENGQPIRMVGFSADITERKEAETERERLLADLARRAIQLQTAAEVSRAASSILNVDELLSQVVELIRARFDLYYAGLFMVDEPGQSAGHSPDGDLRPSEVWAVLRAGTGEAGRRMIRVGHKLKVDNSSMVGLCIAQGKAHVALDVREATRFVNPLLPETRSEMALPLVSRRRVIGAMTIQSTRPAAFTQEDTTVLQTMADQVATAIENAHLFTERQRRITELASLTEISQALSSTLELDQVLETVYQQTGRLFDTASFYIATYEEGSDVWKLALRQERGQRIPPGQFPLGSGLTSYILRNRQPLLFYTGQQLQDFQTKHNVERIGDPAKSWMGVPLIAGGKIVGVMAVQSYEQENLYTSQDLAIFSTIATQAAISIQNAHLFEQARARAEEMEVLNELGQSLSARLSVQQVLDEAQRGISRLLSVTSLTIGLYDPKKEEIAFVFTSTESEVDRQITVIPVSQGMNGYVVRSCKPLLLRSAEESLAFHEAQGIAVVGEPSCCWLGVPLVYSDQVLGVVSVQSYTIPYLYDVHDQNLLTAIASQVAVALQNAYLFEETRRRAQQLETINEIGQTITSTLDADALLRQIVDTTKARFGLYYVSIFLVKDHQLVLQEGTTVGSAGARPERGLVKLDLDGPGLTTLAARTGQPVLVNDVRSDPRYVTVAEMADALSEVAVPIEVKGRVIGVLDMLSDQLSAFDQADVALLQSLASQSGVAIDNARLFEEARTRAQEMATLNELSRALTTRVKVDEVLDEAHRGTSHLITTDSFYVALYAPSKSEVTIALDVTAGEVRRYPMRWQSGNSLTEYIIRHRTPLLIKENVPERRAELGIALVGQDAFSWLGVPLIIGDQVLGVIGAQSYTTPRAFDEHDQELLTAIASQVAIALQNAYLFEETRRRAQQLETINEIGQTITSTLDADALLRQIVDTTKVRFDLYYVSVLLVEGNQLVLQEGTTIGDSGARPERGQVKLALDGSGLTTLAARTGQPVLVNDIRSDPRYVSVPDMADTLSELDVPIEVKGRVIGVLDVQSDQPSAFDRADIALLQSLASQAGAAIDNARLFEEARARAEEMATLNELSRALTTRLNVNEVLEEAYRGASRLMETTDFFVALYNPDKHEITIPLDVTRGQRGSLLTLQSGNSMSDYIIRHRTPVLIREDVPGWRAAHGVEAVGPNLGALSWLGVPMVAGDQVLGVIVVQNYAVSHAFDEHDREMLTAIASQVVIALQNAYLFEETRAHAKEMEVLNELGRSLTTRLNVEAVLEEAYRGAAQLMDTSRFYITLYDAEKDEFTFAFNMQEGVRIPTETRSGRPGLTEYVLETRAPLLISENVAEWADKMGRKLYDEVPLSWLGVPLIVGDRVLGTIAVQDCATPRAYDEHDLEMLTAVASQVAIALQNANLFEEARARAQEMAALNELSRALTTHLTVNEVLEEAYRGASRLMEAPNFIVALYNPDKDEFTISFDMTEGRLGSIRTWRSGKSLSAYIIRHRTPVLIQEDVPGWRAAHGVEEIGHTLGVQSWLGVPMVVGDRVLGVIIIQSYTTPRAFDEHDQELLTSIASQVAIALQNAYLFEETRAHAKEMEVLNELGRALTTRLSVEGVLDEAYRGASRLVNTENSYIALYDADKDEVTFVLFVSEGQVSKSGGTRRSGQGITEYVIRHRAPLLVEENMGERLAELGIELFGQLAQSWLGVPLISGDRVLGVIAAQSYTTPRAYGQHDQELLTAIASQVAIALQNAYLFEETKRRLAQLTALQETTKAVASTLELDQLLRLIAEQATILLQGNGGIINLVDWEKREDETVATCGSQATTLGIRNPLEGGLSGWVALHNQPVISNQLRDDDRVNPNFRSGILPGQNAALAPLTVKDHVMGSLVVMDKPGGFDQADLDLLSALANQTAVAIQNARLFEETKTALVETKKLAEALRVSEERFALAMEGTNDGLWDWDIRGQSLYWSPRFKQLLGYAPDELEVDFDVFTSSLHPDDLERVNAALDAHLKDRALYDVEERLLTKSGKYRWFRARGEAARDETGNPVRMTGAITDITERKEAEAERERLLADLARHAIQLQTAAEVSRAASSILNVDELLPQVVELIRARFNLYYAGLFLVQDLRPGESDQWAILRAGTGEAGRKMIEAGHKLKVDSASMVGSCIAQSKAYVVQDVGEAARFQNPLLPETRSEMALPLTSRGRVIGAMTIQSTQPAAFTQEDTTVLQTMADQVANAIENARLFEEAHVRAEEMATLNELSRALATHLNVNEVLEEAYRGASRLMEAASFFVALCNPDKDEITVSFDMTEGQRRPPRTWRSGNSMSDYIIRHRTPVLIQDDVAGWRAAHGVEATGPILGALSWLGVPMVAGDRALGVIVVQSYTAPCAFDEHDQAMLTAIASQTAIALQNAYLFEQTRTALTEAESLYNASRAIGRATSSHEVGKALMDYAAGSGVDAARVLLFEHDQQGQPVTIVMCEGWAADNRPAQPYGARLPMQDYPLVSLMSYDQPLAVGDTLTDSRLNEMSRQLITNLSGLRSCAMIPMVAGERWVGSVFIGRNQPSTFAEALVRGYWTLAGQAAITLETLRLLAETRRRATQLETASQVARAASSILSMDALLPQVVELIRAHFDLYYVGLFLLDETERRAVLRAGTGEAGRQMIEAGHKLEAGSSSMIGWCVEHGQARIALDVGVEAVRFDNPLLPRTRSEMALPLVSRGRVIGAMTIQSAQSAAFTPEDTIVLQTMADQVANAIENALLFEQTRSALAEVEATHRRYLRERWEEFLTGAAERPMAYVDGPAGLIPVAATQTPELERALGARAPAPETEAPAPGKGETALTQNALTVPIKLRGESIGELGFYDEGAPRPWTEDEQALVQSLADQAALALENARLFQESQIRAEELAVLNELSGALTGRLNVDEVLEETYRGTGRLMDSKNFFAALYDPVKNENVFPIDVEDGQVRRPYNVRRADMGLSGYVIRTRAPLLIPDNVAERMAELGVELIGRPFCSWLGVPLMIGDRVLGVLAVQSYTTPRVYDEHDLYLLTAISSQTAIALQNAYLFEQTQARMQQLAVLNEISRAVSGLLDRESLLSTIYDQVKRIMRTDVFYIGVYNPTTQMVSLPLCYDQGERYEEPDRPLQPGSNTYRVLTTGEPLLIHYTQEETTQAVLSMPRIGKQTDQMAASQTYVPLKIGDQVTGLMSVQSYEFNAYTQEQLNLLVAIANQVAVALQNALLFEEQKQTAERLREVDRVKTEFLANMSHELRTPLNSIIGFSRVILKGIDGPLTDLQKQDLEAIHGSGQHLLGLINDVLDISKIEAGKMELAYEEVDLHSIIRGIMSSAVGLTKGKPIELRQEVPDDLPTAWADPTRTRQILLNLVSNASKFTEQGSITTIATFDDRFVTLAVRDTGIGIPPDKLEKVFEAFTQVDSSSTRRVGGTGLGLAITRHFVEMHGGRLWVESEVGKGSTFYFTLPRAKPEEPAPAEPVRETGKLVVLAIDDDPGVITLYKRYLEKQGYQVIGVSDSRQAVEQAQQIKPDVITVDILMPNKDGWSVIQDLRQNKGTCHIPLVVCSIISDQGKGFSLGAADYLVKPITEDELLGALKRLDGRKQTSVLIIDDTLQDVQLIRRILETPPAPGEVPSRYTVHEAHNGAEGIAAVHQRTPDLIILDLMMPEVDGFAVLEALKGDPATRHIPIIVVTAKELTDEDRQRLNGNIEALLSKGLFNEQDLLSDVMAALNASNLSEAAPGPDQPAGQEKTSS